MEYTDSMMHPFDMNGKYSDTTTVRKLSRPMLIAIGACFIILIIGLIIAIAFAIAGAAKSGSNSVSGESCPANPVVWQDVACCRKTCKKGWDSLPLLLVSMDGFRYDYLQRNKTHSLKRLIDCGVHAPFMFPSYPTKTFPNHYSIITGLYTESHGIIDNTMYDARITPAEDRLFRMDSDSSKNAQWWRGEPFWNTVIKNGLRAATFYWPGSEVPIQGTWPTYWMNYSKEAPFYKRVEQVVEWLMLPDGERPSFLTMYFDQPDADGHNFGPDSIQVTTTLMLVDAQINHLLTRLLEVDLLHCINLVILADHGMQKIEKVITLSESLPQDVAIFGGPVARIALNGSRTTAEKIRDSIECKNDSYRVYLRQDMPRRTHYAANPRIGDVILDGNAGVELLSQVPDRMKLGDHGYDNRVDTMHALFLAWGPSYKQNHTILPFQNIELYNFFADTLKLETRAPTNGTLGVLDEIFIYPPERKVQELSAAVAACASEENTCGTCNEKAAQVQCDNPRVIADTLASSLSDQHMCFLSICDKSIVYNSDLQLAGAVFESSDSKQLSTSTLCKKLTHAEATCQKVTAIETALLKAKMSMVPLHVLTNGSSFQNASATEAWEMKAPMHEGFFTEVWQHLNRLTHQYAERYGQLMVISGSIFDYDSNGLMDDFATAQSWSSKMYTFTDVLVPSHYYRIFIRCNGQWTFPSCNGEPVPLSFILPNVPRVGNCMDIRSYLQMNMARIRDIELLAGIELLQKGLYRTDAHKSILLRTRITEDLW